MSTQKMSGEKWKEIVGIYLSGSWGGDVIHRVDKTKEVLIKRWKMKEEEKESTCEGIGKMLNGCSKPVLGVEGKDKWDNFGGGPWWCGPEGVNMAPVSVDQVVCDTLSDSEAHKAAGHLTVSRDWGHMHKHNSKNRL